MPHDAIRDLRSAFEDPHAQIQLPVPADQPERQLFVDDTGRITDYREVLAGQIRIH